MFEFFIALFMCFIVNTPEFWLFFFNTKKVAPTLVDLLCLFFFIGAYVIWRSRKSRDKHQFHDWR